jgi:hypothetical protein
VDPIGGSSERKGFEMRPSIMLGVALLAVAAGTGSAPAATPGGTVKVSLTSPRVYNGPTRPANITCAANGGVYVVRFGRTTRGNATLRGALTIRAYAGPGDYTGRLTVGATGPAGAAGATLKAVHVSITDAGGQASFSRTLTGARAPRLAGKLVAGTVDWTCAS